MQFWDELKNGVLTQLLAKFSDAIPKIAMALIILLIGRFIADLARKIIHRTLVILQVDRLTDQLNDIELVQRTGARIKISGILSNMVYYVLMLGFIIFATDMLGIPAITAMVRDVIDYLPALFSALILFLLGLYVADILRKAVQTTLQSLGIASAKLIASGVFYLLFLTIAVSALAQAKINTSFIASNLTVIIAAGALAFSFGYGLASRDLVASYLAGFYNRNKVRVGDDVRIIGVRGKVVLMDATSLILQTPERAIVIPLSKLTTEKVEIFYPDGQEDDLLPASTP